MTGIDRQNHAPIVLAHGLFGFERIGVGPWTVAEYFRGIPRRLRKQGFRVCTPRVHPLGGIDRRARMLAAGIDAAFPGESIHIIAHSAGGLDARQLLRSPVWARRILSLTTIATPHLGSALAEEALRRLTPLDQLFQAFGWDHQGLRDILPDYAAHWNSEAEPAEPVPCYCVAGNPPSRDVCWPMRLPHRLLEPLQGPNDGLVPVSSAIGFGQLLAIEPIDHLRQMNWCTRFPSHSLQPRVAALYDHVVANIAQHDPFFELAEV